MTDQDLVDFGVGRDRVDRLLHLDQRQVHVGVPVEADGGDQAAGAGDLVHFAEAAHREQALLDLLAVEPLHLGRRPIAGTHGDDMVGERRSGRRSIGSSRHDIQPPGRRPGR